MSNFNSELIGLSNVFIKNIQSFDINYSSVEKHPCYYKHAVKYDSHQKNIKFPSSTKVINGSKSCYVIDLEFVNKTGICPCCGQVVKKIHDYRYQIIKDLSCFGKLSFLRLRKPRLICKDCNKRFVLNNNICAKYKRTSNRLNQNIIASLSSVRTVKDLAENFNVSTSVIYGLLKYVPENYDVVLPEAIGIDEFKGNLFSNAKYQCVITDLVSGKIIEILPQRKLESIKYYLYKYKNRMDVKYIAMDMTSGYNSLKSMFPNATVIVDNFHIVKTIFHCLDNVRLRFQRQFQMSHRKNWKLNRYLFYKKYDHLTIRQKKLLDIMLCYHEDLRKAHYLKEDFECFENAKTVEEAAKALGSWKLNAEDSDLPEFKEAITAISNWFSEIVNYKQYGLTNACTEGKNNKIKVIKRVAFGYRNFSNFRKIIMLKEMHKHPKLIKTKAIKKMLESA